MASPSTANTKNQPDSQETEPRITTSTAAIAQFIQNISGCFGNRETQAREQSIRFRANRSAQIRIINTLITNFEAHHARRIVGIYDADLRANTSTEMKMEISALFFGLVRARDLYVRDSGTIGPPSPKPIASGDQDGGSPEEVYVAIIRRAIVELEQAERFAADYYRFMEGLNDILLTILRDTGLSASNLEIVQQAFQRQDVEEKKPDWNWPNSAFETNATAPLATGSNPEKNLPAVSRGCIGYLRCALAY